ncbi:hypothetical protein LCGC14_2425990, partial [marine sediment metagenome]
IREGLARRICGLSPDVIASPKTPDRSAYGLADRMMLFLHDNGAVLKVERNLPEPARKWHKPLTMHEIGTLAQVDMVAEGYTATVPLMGKK